MANFCSQCSTLFKRFFWVGRRYNFIYLLLNKKVIDSQNHGRSSLTTNIEFQFRCNLNTIGTLEKRKLFLYLHSTISTYTHSIFGSEFFHFLTLALKLLENDFTKEKHKVSERDKRRRSLFFPSQSQKKQQIKQVLDVTSSNSLFTDSNSKSNLRKFLGLYEVRLSTQIGM